MLPHGATIGRYVVERTLGQGGMGVVYEVRDPALPDRRLALKQVLRAAADREALLRFEREGRLLARLRHPHVLPVHELGLGPEGPYLVTDLVPGETLAEALARGPLAPRRAAEVARGVADALAAVHAAGLVHRDVKPSNVALDAATGAPVLLDFGLAREVDASSLTRTGVVVGTPTFMAPEQAERGAGEGPGLDGRVDVWSLGLVLWAALAGRAPFSGTTLQVLDALGRGPPRLDVVAPGVPAGLVAIVAAASAVDPDSRYPSAGALRDDLDRWLRGQTPRAAAPSRRVVVGALGAALVGAALLAGVGAALLRPAARTAPAPPEAPPTSSAPPEGLAFVAPPATPGPGRLAAWTTRWDARGRGGLAEDDAARLRDGPLLVVDAIDPRTSGAPVAWLDSRTLLVGSFKSPRVDRVTLSADGQAARAPFLAAQASGDCVRQLVVRRRAASSGEGATTCVGVGLDVDLALLVDERGAVRTRWSPPRDAPRVLETKQRNVVVGLSADARTLLVGSSLGEALAFRVTPDGLEQLAAVGPLVRPARRVALSPDGRRAAVLVADKRDVDPILNTIVLADVGRDPAMRDIDTNRPLGHSLVFSPDGAAVLVGDLEGWIRRVEFDAPPAALRDAPRFGDPLGLAVQELVFSPDEARVLALEGDETASVLHALRWPQGTETWHSPPGLASGRWVAWSPDGALLALGHESGAVSLWAAPP